MGPQDNERFIGVLEEGRTRTLEVLWRDFTHRTGTIVSTIRQGEDTWEGLHERDIEDDSRFD